MYTELFDAVLVCNGHYSEPKLPQLPGAEGWPGLLMHSHNYRSAERFKGQHVAVLGASFSGGVGWNRCCSRCLPCAVLMWQSCTAKVSTICFAEDLLECLEL